MLVGFRLLETLLADFSGSGGLVKALWLMAHLYCWSGP